MSNINLNVDVGQTKTLTFNTKDKYNSEDIVFNIAANDTLAAWAKAATKPSYTWSEINGKPTFATVATSGSYNDLTNKPSLNYLPLTGGTMSGNLNMGGKYITNGYMYETSLLWGDGQYQNKRIIDSLLTQPGNRFACTPASCIDVEYSRDNGETWLDYGLTDAQKMNIFTSTQGVYIGKRYNDGAVDVTKDRVRVTWWSYRIGVSRGATFYGDLNKFLIKTSVSATGQVINTKISKLSSINHSNNIDNWTTLYDVVHGGWSIERSYNSASPISTSNGRTDGAWANYAAALRFEFSYDSTSSQQTTTSGAYVYYIKSFGPTIYSHAVGGYGAPYNNQPFDYDGYQNVYFPASVTVSGNATIKKLTLSDDLVLSNGTTVPPKIIFQRNTTTDDYYDYFIKSLSGGGLQIGYNTMGNGVDHQMVFFDWNGGLTATKLIKSGGTSSQFLKADGSVDSNSYATLNSTGKVPTSQLPSYVDDVEEYTNRASFPATGEKGKIYVDTTENDIYRWTGSTYIKISGIIGAQGEKGAQGYQGKSGVDGVQGLQGYQGIKGTDGTNGTNGVQGYRGYQGYTGLQGATGLQGKNGKYGTNFAGCFISSYSLYDNDQCDAGTIYTFNKADFNLNAVNLNTGIADGDTILVIYQPFQENITLVEHYYIKITRFISNESTFSGVVQNWFKIHDGIDGVQGYQGLQGKNGTNGTNGTNGVQGYRGYQGYTGLQGKQGLQGISGALATNHWYLDKANPEVTNNGSSKLIQLDLSTDSIFAKLSNLTNGSLNGRSFIVNCTDSNGSTMINDLFGNLSTYRVPNQVRYHFYIQNMSKREMPVKIHWNSEFYTNVSHRPGWQPQIVLRYGECCKIEFVKFDDSHAWVDVELEGLIYDASTSAASENNEDNAASQIQAYCENNNLSYTLNKESHDIQFNLIDIIADICSKLK